MDRRNFLGGLIATAAGIYLPHKPERIYSFPSSRYLREQRLLSALIDKRFLDGDADIVEQQLAEMRTWSTPQLAAAEATIDEHIKVARINFDTHIGSIRTMSAQAIGLDVMDEQEAFLKNCLRFRPVFPRIVRGGIHLNHPLQLPSLNCVGITLSPKPLDD